MPQGKPTGVRCIQLGDDARCRIFGQPERPAVCVWLISSVEMCGSNQAQALHYLSRLESLTQPAPLPQPVLRGPEGHCRQFKPQSDPKR